jgi:hypothetical protein
MKNMWVFFLTTTVILNSDFWLILVSDSFQAFNVAERSKDGMKR